MYVICFAGVTVAGEPYYKHTDAQGQDGATQYGDFIHILVAQSDQIHYVPGQCCDGNVDQKTHWHVVGVEVYANHGSQFQIDKQQQQILDRGMRLLEYLNKGPASGPHRGSTYAKQGQHVE